MSYNKSYKIRRMGVGIGVFLVLLGLAIKIDFLGYIGLIVVIVSALLEDGQIICLNCNESLTIRGKKSKRCP